jgi:hypothetical protein
MLASGIILDIFNASSKRWVILVWLFGLATLGLCIRWRLRLWRKVRTRVEQDLAAKIDGVVAEFPQEVQNLGGPSVLRERSILRELVRELEAVRGETTR